MKRWILVCAIFIGIALGVAASSARATTINFDTFPDGTPVPTGTIITDQYLVWGATFSSTPSGGPIIDSDGEASSPPNFLIGNPDSYQPITVDFTKPIPFVDVTLISVGDSTVTATAYAPDLTTVLDSVSVTNPGTGVGWYNHNPITLTGSDIARIHFEITKPYPGDGYGIDDICWGSSKCSGAAAVPEIRSATMLTMMLIGSMALLLRRSRRAY